MATITVKGTPFHTIGELPPKGSKAPDFRLTKKDMSDVSLRDYAGKKKILNIVTSLDTSTCATSAKKFEQEVANLDNVVVLTISRDLPFASSRFCQDEGIENVITLSQLRDDSFGKDYGVTFVDGPVEGLLSRSIVVLDEGDSVLYTQQVPENSHEPDYDAALKAVQ